MRMWGTASDRGREQLALDERQHLSKRRATPRLKSPKGRDATFGDLARRIGYSKGLYFARCQHLARLSLGRNRRITRRCRPRGHNRSTRSERICARFHAGMAQVTTPADPESATFPHAEAASDHVRVELPHVQTWEGREASVVRQERLTAGADGGDELEGVRRLDAGARPQLSCGA